MITGLLSTLTLHFVTMFTFTVFKLSENPDNGLTDSQLPSELGREYSDLTSPVRYRKPGNFKKSLRPNNRGLE